jgi:predicted N-acetyltransferase YhbS
MVVTNGGKSVNYMVTAKITIRKACTDDLAAINKVINAAVMSWDLAERVKRLSLPSYNYREHDLLNIELIAAVDDKHEVIGVAAWEQADPRDTPDGYYALLLHGIYVDPQHQHQGIGTQLLQAAEQAADAQNYNGLLVKAQASAAGFFVAQGMRPLSIENEKRDYAHRYWKLIEKRRI